MFSPDSPEGNQKYLCGLVLQLFAATNVCLVPSSTSVPHVGSKLMSRRYDGR